MLGQTCFDAYFDGDNVATGVGHEGAEREAVDDTRDANLDTFEAIHLGQLRAVDWGSLYRKNRTRFKENDASWLFFYAIAHHCILLPSLGEDSLKITTKM
jgi:hypothetical protein